jgi:hypothetical protein
MSKWSRHHDITVANNAGTFETITIETEQSVDTWSHLCFVYDVEVPGVAAIDFVSTLDTATKVLTIQATPEQNRALTVGKEYRWQALVRPGLPGELEFVYGAYKPETGGKLWGV